MGNLVRVTFLAIGIALPAMADNTLTPVTPASIEKQALTLGVIQEEYAIGAVCFQIYVSGGTEQLSSSHRGEFAVWDDKVTADPACMEDFGLLAFASCEVQETATGDTLVYEVCVNYGMGPLDRVTFTFFNCDDSTLSCDGYQFILWEFAVKRK